MEIIVNLVVKFVFLILVIQVFLNNLIINSMKKIFLNSIRFALVTLMFISMLSNRLEAQSMFDRDKKLVQCFVLYEGDIIQIGNECDWGSSECKRNPCTPGLGG